MQKTWNKLDNLTGEATIESGRYRINKDLIINGGTLHIEPGVTLDFANGRGITCKRGFIIAKGTSSDRINLTSSSGKWSSLLLDGSEASFEYCNFSNSGVRNPRRVDGGGAIHAYRSKLYLGQSVFRNNSSSRVGGGAISADDPVSFESWNKYKQDIKIIDCEFYQNSGGEGGAIYLGSTQALLRGNTLRGNTAKHGGAIFIRGSNAELYGNQITGNTAKNGGGLYVQSGATFMKDNKVRDNKAERGGGMAAERMFFMEPGSSHWNMHPYVRPKKINIGDYPGTKGSWEFLTRRNNDISRNKGKEDYIFSYLDIQFDRD